MAYQNSLALKLRRWVPVLTRFVLVQSTVQAITLITGFLIVRTLPKQDYAYYTLVNNAITAIFTLSNCGVTDAATAIGGRVWEHRASLGQMVASAMRLRTRFALIATVPSVAVVGWLLLRNGAGLFETVFLLALACVAAQTQFATAILLVVLRIRSDVGEIQRLDISVALLRAVPIIALLAFLNVALAIVITVFSVFCGYLIARHSASKHVDLRSTANLSMEAELGGVARRQWPNEVNYILSGQITLLLIAIFGGADSIANFGALGRIAAMFGIFSAVMQSIVLPRYARCQTVRDLSRVYVAVFLAGSAAAMIPAAIAYVMPAPLLWILGAQYSGLGHDLTLVALYAGMTSLAFLSWGMNSIRAWIIPSWINIPAGIGFQAVAMLIIGVSTLEQILYVGIVSSALSIALNVAATWVFTRSFKAPAQSLPVLDIDRAAS